MLYLHRKQRWLATCRASGLLKNSMFGIVMGMLWFGSLAVYSKAALLIGDLGSIAAWPLFMVLIILTANPLGWRQHEWQRCPSAVKPNALLAIMVLVLAVIILAYSASLSH